MNSHRFAHCIPPNPQPPEAPKIGTQKKRTSLRSNSERLGRCWKRNQDGQLKNEPTQIFTLRPMQSTTIRGHENWNAEAKILHYVPTLNASEGVGSGTKMDNLRMNPHRFAHCVPSNPQPSEAKKIGTQKKRYFSALQLSTPRKVLEMRTSKVYIAVQPNHHRPRP